MIHHNPDITRQEHLDKLPAFSASAVDAVLADTNLKLSESVKDTVEIIKNTTMPLVKRTIIMAKDICDCMLTSGFGTGVIIASGVSSSNSEVQTLDEAMKKVIQFEELSRARILKIKRINPDTGAVDARAEVPNWAKTIGATLPSWSDPASKQNLAVMMVEQIKKNLQEIVAFRKNPQGTPERLASVCSALFHTEFLIGVLEGLYYAKPADFRAMTHTYDTPEGKLGVAEFFKKLKNLVEKNDITGMVGAAIAS